MAGSLLYGSYMYHSLFAAKFNTVCLPIYGVRNEIRFKVDHEDSQKYLRILVGNTTYDSIVLSFNQCYFLERNTRKLNIKIWIYTESILQIISTDVVWRATLLQKIIA